MRHNRFTLAMETILKLVVDTGLIISNVKPMSMLHSLRNHRVEVTSVIEREDRWRTISAEGVVRR